MKKLLCVDPAKRLSAVQALEHPWLKDAPLDFDVFTEKEKNLIQKEYMRFNLKKSGNESVDSLLGMLKKYKRQQRNTQDEIEKLSKLLMIKEAEIVAVTEELKSLNDFRANMHGNSVIKTQQAGKMIGDNKAVIKRNDKLIVDLQQKNEVCQIAIA